MEITIVDEILKEAPDSIKLLPDDWEGEFQRIYVTILLSKLALRNPKFGYRDFIITKLLLSMKKYMKQKNLNELYLLRRECFMMVDDVRDKDITYLTIHIAYAKKHELNL